MTTLFPEAPKPRQQVLDLGYRAASARADFLVSQSNREAVLWLDRWPGWPGHALALSGPAGCGKTHLAHVWAAQAEASWIEPAALEMNIVSDLLRAPRNLVLENAASLSGDSKFEQALFHVYNALREMQHYLLITDSLPPARWPVVLPDLKSRLASLPCLTIEPPDDSLLKALLAKLFADRQVKVSPDVIDYLIPRMERSFAAARAMAETLDHMALSRGSSITVALARAALEDGFKG